MFSGIGLDGNMEHLRLDDPFTVPKDNVFVLSDNLSAQHDDSRVFGPISKSVISGWVW